MINEFGSALKHPLAPLILAVERTERIRLQSFSAVPAHSSLSRPEICHERLTIQWPTLAAPDRVHLQRKIFEPECIECCHGYEHALRVCHHIVLADNLEAGLPELPKPPRLGALVAKHATEVPQAHRLRPVPHTVLKVSPNDGRRPFRTKRQSIPSARAKRVHFLFHDVGRETDAARKHLFGFKGRSFNSPEAIRVRKRCCRAFDHFIPPKILRKEIVHSRRGLVSLHDSRLLIGGSGKY